jgi:hypothetical protein
MLITDKQAHLEAIRQNTIAANTLTTSIAQKNAETVGLGVKKAANTADLTGLTLQRQQTGQAVASLAPNAAVAASKVTAGSSYLGP